GRQQLGDLLADALADARKLSECLLAATREQLVAGSVARLDRVRRFLVGARLEGHVLHLEEEGDLSQNSCDLGVGQGHDRTQWTRSLTSKNTTCSSSHSSQARRAKRKRRRPAWRAPSPVERRLCPHAHRRVATA